MTRLSSNSYIGVGLVITLIGAAVTFGVMWNKVDSVAANVEDVKIDLRDVKIQVSALKDLLIQKLASL